MPGMDGFELAELMRGTAHPQHPDRVRVGRRRELNYAFKGYEAGAVDFLYKPLDPDAVRSKVKVFVTLDQQRRDPAPDGGAGAGAARAGSSCCAS
jgi:DNA-binding response OmpR family regulator